MKQLLIIPDINNMHKSIELAQEYSLGFEYNEFFIPKVLDDDNGVQSVCQKYAEFGKPVYSTVHGAFYDVIPFSEDPKIREVSNLRVEQSIGAARQIGAKAVVFHTNYNPFLNTDVYIESWIENNKVYWSEVLRKNPDVNIYLENMFDTSPDMMVALSEGLKGHANYGVCFDYAHAELSCTEPDIWARELSPYIKHVHINDNDLISDSHLAWGDGSIDRQAFYRNYEDYMNGATVLVETSQHERKVRSLEVLKAEGFI